MSNDLILLLSIINKAHTLTRIAVGVDKTLLPASFEDYFLEPDNLAALVALLPDYLLEEDDVIVQVEFLRAITIIPNPDTALESHKDSSYPQAVAELESCGASSPTKEGQNVS